MEFTDRELELIHETLSDRLDMLMTDNDPDAENAWEVADQIAEVNNLMAKVSGEE